ncbi:hypothetical protein H6H02_08100 [Coleofasciculus sp. FACHB-1120]|nr:hypothetical protein [Coleofasciculus sp. FACHB-1120]
MQLQIGVGKLAIAPTETYRKSQTSTIALFVRTSTRINNCRWLLGISKGADVYVQSKLTYTRSHC